MKYRALLFVLLLAGSCNWKDRAKQAVNKTGEIAARAGSELADGVAKGVEQTFQNEVIISTPLQQAGLSHGKISVTSSDTADDDIITAYLVFNSNFDRDITVKVFDENGQEYGRAGKHVSAAKGEAKYVDFIFDKRTHIRGRGKLSFE